MVGNPGVGLKSPGNFFSLMISFIDGFLNRLERFEKFELIAMEAPFGT
jgi:hypothetical protein